MPEFIDKALMSHAQIKKRLCVAIRSPEHIDLEEIRDSHRCVFGQWIDGSDCLEDCGSLEFTRLKDIHRQFHEAAYQAALAARHGSVAEAETSIASGDFEITSRAMTQVLVELKAVRKQRKMAQKRLEVGT